MPSLKVALSLKVATAPGAGTGLCPLPGLPSHLGLAQGALLRLCQRRGGQQAEDAGNQEGAREGHGRVAALALAGVHVGAGSKTSGAKATTPGVLCARIARVGASQNWHVGAASCMGAGAWSCMGIRTQIHGPCQFNAQGSRGDAVQEGPKACVPQWGRTSSESPCVGALELDCWCCWRHAWVSDLQALYPTPVQTHQITHSPKPPNKQAPRPACWKPCSRRGPRPWRRRWR